MSNLIYLDNSATTFPKPEEVYSFMDTFYRNHGVNPGRSGFDAAIETEEMVTDTRKMLTNLFNGDDPDRLRQLVRLPLRPARVAGTGQRARSDGSDRHRRRAR